MKLDHDCIRELLLYSEENLTYSTPIKVSSVKSDTFSPEEFVYTADKLIEAGYLDGKISSGFSVTIPEIYVFSITWSGHQLLEDIRNDNNWNKIKKISSNIGFASLKVISAIAEGVATAAINKQLVLPE